MTPTQTVTISIDLDIGDALRKTLISLGWTPPGEMPPLPDVGEHDFVSITRQQDPNGRYCWLIVSGGRICNRPPDDPIHQTEDQRLADWERELLDKKAQDTP